MITEIVFLLFPFLMYYKQIILQKGRHINIDISFSPGGALNHFRKWTDNKIRLASFVSSDKLLLPEFVEELFLNVFFGLRRGRGKVGQRHEGSGCKLFVIHHPIYFRSSFRIIPLHGRTGEWRLWLGKY